MGSYGLIILVVVLALVGFFTYRSYKSKMVEVNKEHAEKMQEIEAKVVDRELDEAELYIGLFIIYARDHVKRTGVKLSSNRLGAIEPKFREGYQILMSRELPKLNQFYKRIKTALKEADLMVDGK